MSGNTLIECIYCGHKVSKSALRCPRCEKPYFEGQYCGFCSRRLPQENLLLRKIEYCVTVNEGSWNEERLLDTCRVYYCPECLHARFTPPPHWRCCECQTVISNATYVDLLGQDLSVGTRFSCPNCGSRHPFAEREDVCKRCDFPLFDFQRRTRDSDDIYGRGRSKESGIHDFCSIIQKGLKSFLMRNFAPRDYYFFL